MRRITLVGLLIAAGCAHVPTTAVEHGALRIRADSLRSAEQFARDLAACQARIAHELAAERPAVSPRVTAFGSIGAAMDDDIDRHKAVAKLWICLEMHDYVLERKPSPSPAWYLLDLLTCVQPVQETPAPDAAQVRACMETLGHQVPW
jgi:hypothetical protein